VVSRFVQQVLVLVLKLDRVRRELFAHTFISLARRCWQSTIFLKAREMGANTSAAFTDYVTHLIAEVHGGGKYWVRRFSESNLLPSATNAISVCT
jgi:hypothetical protein